MEEGEQQAGRQHRDPAEEIKCTWVTKYRHCLDHREQSTSLLQWHPTAKSEQGRE